MAGQPAFFDLADRYDAQSAAGDPLERLSRVIDFEVFHGLLIAALRRSVRGKVPDATTVWLFRERLMQAKAVDKLFARFDAALTDRSYLAMGGQISDATVVPAPKQRNTEGEKITINEG